tara:strand:+ start:262 stop:459 length:198 start_codon:yes stop_codon:yes gene_type:complete
MNFKLDIKLLITFLAIASGLGGFYYTTQLRLDRVEIAIEAPVHDCQSLKKQVQRLSKRVKALENK